MNLRGKTNLFSSTLVTLMLTLAFGCTPRPVREITDARFLMAAAKNSCSSVYIPAKVRQAQEELRQIDLGMKGKIRKSNRELKKLALDVQNLSKEMINRTTRIKSDLYHEIQQNILLSIKKIHEGEQAEANRYARREYKLAIRSVQEARELSHDECRYREALAKSNQAIDYAEMSIKKAKAFKKELERKLPVYHIVKKGETLKSIAKNSPLYGDESFWKVIYKANRDQIRNPDNLYPGQQLFLPAVK